MADGSMEGWRCTFSSAGQRLTTTARPDPRATLAAPPGELSFFRIESPPIEIPAGLENARFTGVIQPGGDFSSRDLRFIIEELGEPGAGGEHPRTKVRPHQKYPGNKSKRGDAPLATDSKLSINKSTRYLRASLEGETAGVFTLTAFALAPH